MKTNRLTLGTRGSPLALWQAERVKALLAAARPDVAIEIEIIHTRGDKILDKPFIQVGGKGIFTKEIEEALLAGSIDFAVHSYKDLPSILPEGLAIVCIPERDSPLDALFSRGAACLADLPEAPIVATGSPRRRAQILALRPQAEIIDLRGNVNTRLRKFNESTWDAMIMAHAAIRRMGWDETLATPIAIKEMLPAPAQGALAIEARADDAACREVLRAIHSEAAAVGVAAERALLAGLEGSCHIPIAAYADVDGNSMTLHGLLSAPDGEPLIRRSLTSPSQEAESLGTRLAETILAEGGREIIDALRSDS